MNLRHRQRGLVASHFGVVLSACLGCSSTADDAAGPTPRIDAGADGDASSLCKPETCTSLHAECGKVPDRCGAVLDCGTCAADKHCGGAGPNRCGDQVCSPKTCVDIAANCGDPSDGCSSTLSCGDCTPPQTCGGGGVDNACGCTPTTCAAQGKVCGQIADGCGGTLQCGGCNDGVSDGACVDGVCVHNCAGETGYGNCGADSGGWGGDDCSSDNQKECLDWWFEGWCNRRANYSGWLGVMNRWATERCDTHSVQIVEHANADDESLYYCVSTTSHRYECFTPLVLAFRDQSLRMGPCEGVFFDVAALGGGYQADCPSAPWLAMDRNGNGQIDDGTELFGSARELIDGRRAGNGFEALAELDTDGDSVITPADLEWDKLLVWSPGTSPAKLEARSIEALALHFEADGVCDSRGNCSVGTSAFHYRDRGERIEGMVVDVNLRIRRE